MPIDYREIESGRRCNPSNFGKKLIELDQHLGYLQLPGNESTTWNVSTDISGKQTFFDIHLILNFLLLTVNSYELVHFFF